MELTPELLEEQEFPVVLRGYDTDAVDDFLERVGAGVRVLLERLDQAGARLRDLEAEVASGSREAAAAPDPQTEVERVSRALVLAQQAADQALAEAEADAGKIVAEAQADADARRLKADADVEERARTAESEVQARADALKAVRDRELAELAARENTTRAELHRVEEVLGRQRNQLAAVAASAQELLDKVAAPGGGEEPASTAVPPTDDAPTTTPPVVDHAHADEGGAADSAADVDEHVAEATGAADESPPTPAYTDGPPTEAIPVIADEPAPEPDHAMEAEDDDAAVPPPSASNGDTFWRASSGPEETSPAPTSGLFDQDEDLPAAAPRLRSVAPPEDDPFLAALRGDDQAAAMLHDQPLHGDEPTSGLIRRFRRS